MKNTVINLADHITDDKPYNKCISCKNLGIRCDGPNFLAMSSDRWAEWCKLRKDYLGWSNQKLSDLSGISKPTIDRILSGHAGDVRNSTMEAVTKALVNGTWGQFPCADPNPENGENTLEVELLRKEKEYLMSIVDKLHDSTKWYKRVILITGIICILVFVALIVDLCFGHVGWIRY